MEKILAASIWVMTVCSLIGIAVAKEGKKSGDVLFREYCAACHADGGNTLNPQKGLRGKELAANSLKNWQDIVATMRNPGPAMTRFDEPVIPDRDAREIAQYILKNF